MSLYGGKGCLGVVCGCVCAGQVPSWFRVAGRCVCAGQVPRGGGCARWLSGGWLAEWVRVLGVLVLAGAAV